jgi:PAS domain-containing protein
MLIEAGSNQSDLEQCDRLSAGLERINSGGVDALLLDLGLPDSNGIDTFLRVYAQAPEVPTVVLTGLDDARLAAKLVSSGAQDYLVKGQFDDNLLMRTIRYSIERKRSEKAMRESEARFRSLIEKNADGIIIIDNDGKIAFINPAAEALFQRAADELVGEAFGFPLVAGEIAEIDISRKGGEIATVQMRSAEIEWEGELAGRTRGNGQGWERVPCRYGSE